MDFHPNSLMKNLLRRNYAFYDCLSIKKSRYLKKITGFMCI